MNALQGDAAQGLTVEPSKLTVGRYLDHAAGTTTYTYDPAGRLATYNRAGTTQTRTYDPDNTLIPHGRVHCDRDEWRTFVGASSCSPLGLRAGRRS
jgi:YD repeat-containing protein